MDCVQIHSRIEEITGNFQYKAMKIVPQKISYPWISKPKSGHGWKNVSGEHASALELLLYAEMGHSHAIIISDQYTSVL